MKVVFELIKSFEFEISSDKGKIRGKVEIFQNVENSKHFRFSTSEAEMFRLTPTFPQNEKEQPLHITDEMLWTERIFSGTNNGKKEFIAEDVDEAIRFGLLQIETFYNHLLV